MTIHPVRNAHQDHVSQSSQPAVQHRPEPKTKSPAAEDKVTLSSHKGDRDHDGDSR